VSNYAQSNHVLTCRGIDAQLGLAKLIQIIGGHGTLSEEERRFFGQDTGNERRPNTLLAGKSSRAFADAIVEVLRGGDVNLAVGAKKLLGSYVQLISQPLRHRMLMDRIPSMIGVMDDDSSHRRLVGDKDFKKFMRDQIAGLYIAPFINVMALALSYVNYKLIPVPTPFFIPLAMASGPYTETETRTTGGGSTSLPMVADVSWTDMTVRSGDGAAGAGNAVIGAATLSEGVSYPEGTGPWRIFAGSVSDVQIVGDRILEFTIPARFTTWGRSVGFRLTLPLIRAQRASEQSWVGIVDSPTLVGDRRNPPNFAEGTFRLSVRNTSRILTNLPGLMAIRSTTAASVFTIRVRGGTSRRPSSTVTTTRNLTTPEEATRLPRIAKLNTMAVLPDLWWACPPACNVIIPGVIQQAQVQPMAADAITRLVAKVQPGRAGSRRSYVQTFSAPSSGDFNVELANPNADPMGARQWQSIEYPSGPVADISYLDNLAKHVNAPAFREYISAKITLEFWDKRLGTSQMAVALVDAPRLLVGLPALIILSKPREQETSTSVSQEELDLRARAQALLRLLASINRALAGRGGAAPVSPTALIRYLEQLIANSAFLANTRAADPSGANLRRRGTGLLQSDGSVTGFSLNRSERTVAQASGGGRSVASATQAVVPIEGAAGAGDRQLSSSDLRIQSSGISVGYVVSILGSDSGAEVIVPSGDRRIASLPPVSRLREWLARAQAYRPRGDGCRAALLADQAMVQEELDRVREALRAIRGEDAPASPIRAVFGKVVSITESAQAGPAAPQYQVSLSHVRYVDDDLNIDNYTSDNVEEVVAFGPNGYYDDMYRAGNIGEKVYRPMFGCGSLVDLADGMEDGGPPVADGTADISDIRARLRSTSACSSSVDDAEDGVSSALTTRAAAERILSEYSRVYVEGGEEAAYEWWQEITARPGMPLSSAYGRDEDSEIDGFFSESVPDPDADPPISSLRGHDEFTDSESEFYARRYQSCTMVADRSPFLDTE
jgi:hypothetical protein